MITNAAVSAELARGRVLVYDAVTITVTRGRVVDFGTETTVIDIKDEICLTSCPYPLNVQDQGGTWRHFLPILGCAYSRSRLKQQLGREVSQVGISFTGPVSVALKTDRVGVADHFATSLRELASLGLLDGANVTIDQVIMPDGVIPPDSIVTIPPVRKFAGIIRQATPSMETVTLTCTDPLILGGGSVPVSVFTPECRWGFCDGRCPAAMMLLIESPWAIGTHMLLDGGMITFPSPGVVRLPLDTWMYLPLAPWGVLVPQDGPMMGVRIQIGAAIDTIATGRPEYTDFQLADSLPWDWSCTTAHLEFQCSKRTENASSDIGRAPPPCGAWSLLPLQPGKTSTLRNFGGFPDLPQPEGA